MATDQEEGFDTDETHAIELLKDELKQNPAMTRADAMQICKPFGIGERGFQNRVWPNARAKAGLSPLAEAGRKPAKRTKIVTPKT